MIVQLSRHGLTPRFFAPEGSQVDVINHSLGAATSGETRSMQAESARITRGNVEPLSAFFANRAFLDFCALLIPGGFGAAKNLCTYATDSEHFKVNEQVEKAMRLMNEGGKALGLSCIAPLLAAKLIPGVQITMGGARDEDGKWPHVAAVVAAKKLGVQYVQCDVNEVHHDAKNKVVTTPAYMCGTAAPHEVFDGVTKLVDVVVDKYCQLSLMTPGAL